MLVPCLLLALVAGRSDGVEARGSQAARPSPARATAAITIDYPEEGSIFRPRSRPRRSSGATARTGVTFWRIDVSFGDGSATIHATSKGERLRIGKIDPDCVADTNEPPKLTPATGGGAYLDARRRRRGRPSSGIRSRARRR